ncbi:hypothetical protein Patl1_19646 [Pistacia atlantica]|uniref:Uncharacterized protein n=1 Tax=Pistacia atlantica TaxID=434234 RepID=A0ACC1BXB0_9ROSI|nr:hypothetical protein Patl1_19646 [Pistacia atlantica]
MVSIKRGYDLHALKHIRWQKSSGTLSSEFAEYIKQRGYDLHDVKAYGQMLWDAGFVDVIAEDRTDQFIKVLQQELDTVGKDKDAFISDFSQVCIYLRHAHCTISCLVDFVHSLSTQILIVNQNLQEDYDAIVGGWKAKRLRSSSGDQRWGLFIAKKN